MLKHDQDSGSATPDAGMTDLSDLPPPETSRWVARRKAQVVEAVRNGRLTLEGACRRYNISFEEYDSWTRAIERHGVRGLRVTRLQEFRPRPGA
jgi:hypothetical protein